MIGNGENAEIAKHLNNNNIIKIIQIHILSSSNKSSNILVAKSKNTIAITINNPPLNPQSSPPKNLDKVSSNLAMSFPP